jgi:hypothetical protein
MQCVNLRERFGKRYRVRHEESWHAEGRRVACPELMILLCKYGHVYPWGGRMLAASVDGYPKIAGRLRRLGCVEVAQDGDFGELTVIFDVADFVKVAKVMRPRRRRQMTPEQRAELVARLRQSRQSAAAAPETLLAGGRMPQDSPSWGHPAR